MTGPTYDDVLTALMGMLGRRVVISGQGEHQDDAATLFMVTGTLAAQWDQDVLDANGAGDVAIFRLEKQTFAAFIERESFRRARITDASVHVLLGHVWLEFDPPSILDQD